MIRNERAAEKAYRYYVGETDPADPFLCDPKAYVTLNSLLFEGISTEYARVRENRKLDPVFLQDIERTAGFLTDLLSLFRKTDIPRPPVTVWRVERLSDYEVMKKTGILQSFISTSKTGFLDSYTDKTGLVLMTFRLQEGIPYIDAAEILKPYPKPEEAEITLPPYLFAQFSERDPDERESMIRDSFGNGPAVVCDVSLSGERRFFRDPAGVDEKDISASVRLYECLNEGKDPSEDDIASYLRVKSYIRSRI